MERLFNNLHRTIEWLDLLFSKPEEALVRRSVRPPGKALRDFVEDHLPFLLAYPVIIAISPYTWIHFHFEHSFPSIRRLLIPPAIVIFSLIAAAFYDKLLEYRSSPFRMADQPKERNVALFFLLPMSSSLLFFLIHPAVGFFMLFASFCFSFFQCARHQSRLRSSSLRSVVAEMVLAGAFLLLPPVALLFLYNLALTGRILFDLFSGTGPL